MENLYSLENKAWDDLFVGLLNEATDHNPCFRSGRRTIKGTRFLVSQLFAELANGESIESISEEYNLDKEKLEKILHSISFYFEKTEFTEEIWQEK